MRLLILLQGDSWDRRYQASALAASAAAAGDEVELVLLSGALAAWVKDEWNRLDPDPPLTAARIEEVAFAPLDSLIHTGRETGRLRLYGCSASARLYDLDLGRVQDRVDAILGWQSFASRIGKADRVVSF